MLSIYFLNIILGFWHEQFKALEKDLQCKLTCNDSRADATDIARIIRWAEQEQIDALICTWDDYEAVMSNVPRIPVYPVSLTGFDTSVILHLLKKDLKKKNMEHLHRVVLGTTLPITVRLDFLEEMFGLELYNPVWQAVLPQSYFDELSREGYEVVVCRPDYAEMVRKSGMYPFFDLSAMEYIDFAQDIRNAVRMAAEGLQLRQALKENENMLNYSFEAICMLDREGRLTAYNEQATHMFTPAGEPSYIGRYFSELVPAVSREELYILLHEGKSFFSRIIEARQEIGMLNITCNFKKGLPDGAVVHFMTIRKIDEMESQVKTELYQKGHVARYRFADIVGQSEALSRSRSQAKRFAKYNSNVLLFGESGCGKELFAQGIHNDSLRKNQPFVAVNCGSLPTNLLESELFGYVDGAFTGALKKGKKGLFEIANKGTIFLDEISEMDMQGQSRLLRVLEEREIMRIGDDRVIPVDVRVIAATNRNLEQMVEEGVFREDLYYRLNILSLTIPPLRERGNDIILLTEIFIDKFGKRYQKNLTLSDGAKTALLNHPWKGNVRQLRNFCERLVILADQREVSEEMILEGLGSTGSYINKTNTSSVPAAMEQQGSEDERDMILKALDNTGGKREKAAALLGISKATLWRKMKKYQIE